MLNFMATFLFAAYLYFFKKKIVVVIVFCGYGWYNEETKYNDTEGLDLKNKIVLVMTRNLEIARDTSNKEDQTNTEMMKMSKAFMGGAKALILVPDPLNPDKSWFDMVKNYLTPSFHLCIEARAFFKEFKRDKKI